MSDGEDFNVGDMSDLPNGEMRACSAGTIDVVVCRVQGTLYALEDLCSHADTTLSDGLLHGYNVTCALHGAQFDVRDGSHKGPPAYCGVRSFPVAEGPDGVVVTVASKKSSGPSDGPPSGYYQTR